MLSLLNAVKNRGINCTFYPIFFESLISRARNASVAHFLEDEESTHLLFDGEKVDFPMGGTIRITKDGLLELDYLPTGFLLISKTAIKTLIEKYPNLKYRNDIDGYGYGDNFYNFFNVGVNQAGIYESEDWGFCSLWKSVGGQVLIHPEVNVKHLGWHEYTGNVLNYLDQMYASGK